MYWNYSFFLEKFRKAVEVGGLFPTIYKVFFQIPGVCLGFLPSTVLRYHDIYIYIHILHYIHFVCDVILFTYILYYDYICTYKYIYMLSIRYLLTPKTTSIELSFVPQPESLKSSTWNPDLPMGFCCFFLSSLFCDKNGSSRCFFDCYKHQKKRIDPLNSFLDGRLKKNWVPPTSQTK